MPSDHEIKQLMTEKGFPFFEGGGLNDLKARLEALEKLNEKALKEIAAKKSKAAKDKQRAEEKAARKAVAKHKAELAEDIKKAEEKREQEKTKDDEEKGQEPKPDVKATVGIDDSGRAEVVETE